jgi:hypothetical protein
VQVSIWVREWTLERWEETAQVTLKDDLPKLKVLSRQPLDAGAEVGDIDSVEDDSSLQASIILVYFLSLTRDNLENYYCIAYARTPYIQRIRVHPIILSS